MAKNEIILRTSTPLEAEGIVKALLEGGFKTRQADIYYCPRTGKPRIEKDDAYPLILHGFMHGFPLKVKVYELSAGFASAGSSAMVNILTAAGFKFNEKDIIYSKKVDKKTGCVDLTYTRKF